MINYPVSKQLLEDLIEAERPGWLARAADRTATFEALGKYEESSSIWSEVKPVFMELQHDKCAYCERQLESEEFGRIEHDLEHFRPKKKAKPWKPTPSLQQAGVTVPPPASGNSDPGYHLLAYNPLNYCTSCKTCNSGLKRDNFPIEGPREPTGDDPVALSTEKPLLVNPLGNFDDDPESLIGFYGLSPMAVAPTGYKRRRGLVSIAFFRLDDPNRKSLFRERASVITKLYAFMQQADQAGSQAIRDTYEQLVDLTTAVGTPHASCARCFRRLYRQDPTEATEVFELCVEYLASISG